MRRVSVTVSLEALHPDGHGSEVVVLGPAASDPGRHAGALAPDGLVVAPRPGRRLRRELRAAGLEAVERLLHVPDFETSRFVMPLRGPAAGWAIARAIPQGRAKRLGARVLSLTGAGPTSTVFRRPGARPLLAWLCALDPPVDACQAVIVRGWRAGGAVLVHRVPVGAAAPDLVAKVGANAAEARALRDVAPSARTADVDVPRLVHEGRLGDAPLLVQGALPGVPAARRLRGSPRRAARLLHAVAGWLGEWNRATAARRPFGAADAERHVLGPAGRVLEAAQVESLRELCARCDGLAVPFVAAHHDLTAANLLVDGSRLAVVDWEEAAAQALPLTDLAYAAADFAAAVDGYRDRPAAFAAAFARDATQGLLREHAAALALEPPVVELCLRAVWLRHADDERRRGAAERPFAAILRQALALESPGEP